MSPEKGPFPKESSSLTSLIFRRYVGFRGSTWWFQPKQKNKHLDIQTPQLRTYDFPPQKEHTEKPPKFKMYDWMSWDFHRNQSDLLEGMWDPRWHIDSRYARPPPDVPSFPAEFFTVHRRRWRGRGKIGNLQGQAIRGQLRKLSTVTSSSSVSGIMMSWWPTGLWSHLWKGDFNPGVPEIRWFPLLNPRFLSVRLCEVGIIWLGRVLFEVIKSNSSTKAKMTYLEDRIPF